MLQVVQYQKSGEMLVEDMPAPNCPENGILVRATHTVISAGTEKTSVENAQASLIQRAKRQPQEVKMVMDFVKRDGLVATAKRVLNKLDSNKALGYSASGIVIESRCDEFAPGDRVACAGAGIANHAEIMAIPKNLAMKVPDNVELEEAAYSTIVSIAMQGVRQSEAKLGETVTVIGLGLLGQITCKLLSAAGCRVVGLDINEGLFERAMENGCDAVYKSSPESIDQVVAFSRGIGCDSVIITASTSSDEPMDLAIKMARKKGKVIIVGAIGMNIKRNPFYTKELDIKISCSYGPGRYDSNYEEKGIDYPVSYVRWTENRNMIAFLDLLASKKMEVNSLTTHRFDVNEAEKAYELITGKVKEEYLGIVLTYPERKEALTKKVDVREKPKALDNVKIGFVGAGAFAQTFLIPPLKSLNTEFVSVSTETPLNANNAAKHFGFKSSTTDSNALINDKDVNTVFIASRHDSHAGFVKEAIKNNKTVFVEKPLAINEAELEEIDSLVKEKNGKVFVGFNRRFSKAFKEMDKFFAHRKEPMAITYRVNAGFIPKSHWISAPEQGGRIIGEACHFIDCMVYLTKALPVKIYAESMSSDNPEQTNNAIVSISIKFSDGSIGTVHYFANGDKTLMKEYCEVFCEKSSAIMKNFKTLDLYRGGSVKSLTLDGLKGHKEEVKEFIDAVRKGNEMPITYEELKAVTEATFAAELSLSKGLPVIIKD